MIDLRTQDARASQPSIEQIVTDAQAMRAAAIREVFAGLGAKIIGLFDRSTPRSAAPKTA